MKVKILIIAAIFTLALSCKKEQSPITKEQGYRAYVEGDSFYVKVNIPGVAYYEFEKSGIFEYTEKRQINLVIIPRIGFVTEAILYKDGEICLQKQNLEAKPGFEYLMGCP